MNNYKKYSHGPFQGKDGFCMPFLGVIFCVVYLLFFSHLGENVNEYGYQYQGIVSYFCSDYLKLKGNDLQFTLSGFSDEEIQMLKKQLPIGTKIRIASTKKIYKSRSDVLQICFEDGTIIEYRWLIKNCYIIIVMVICVLTIPLFLWERKRMIREYGPTTDPSIIYSIKEIFRRYQRPYIDDKQTTDKSQKNQQSKK